jgi:hypothetical protein
MYVYFLQPPAKAHHCEHAVQTVGALYLYGAIEQQMPVVCAALKQALLAVIGKEI